MGLATAGDEPEALWDALPHDRQQLSHSLFRLRRVDEVEVADAPAVALTVSLKG